MSALVLNKNKKKERNFNLDWELVGWVLWYINQLIYHKMPNPDFTYILKIWFGFMVYQPL